jgi:hypothetical protein
LIICNERPIEIEILAAVFQWQVTKAFSILDGRSRKNPEVNNSRGEERIATASETNRIAGPTEFSCIGGPSEEIALNSIGPKESADRQLKSSKPGPHNTQIRPY